MESYNSLPTQQVSPVPHPTESPSHLHLIPKAVALIVLLGGILFLLGANGMLPGIPNQISYLGPWGEALGALMVAGGGIALFYLCRGGSSEPKSPPPKDPAPLRHNSGSARGKELNSFSQGLAKSTPSKAKINRNYREVLELAEQHRRQEKEDFEILKLRPTNVANGEPLSQQNYLECGQLGIDLLVKYTFLDVEISRADNGEGKQDTPFDKTSVEQHLSECIDLYKKIYSLGKYRIHPIPDTTNKMASVVIGENKLAQQLNDKVDSVKKEVAERLAKVYTHIDNPPPEFADCYKSRALVELCASWKEELSQSSN